MSFLKGRKEDEMKLEPATVYEAETLGAQQSEPIQEAILDGKATLEFLKSVAALIHVPFLRGTIEVAIKVLEICQDVIEIEASAQALQDRVSKIMRAIMANVTAGSSISGAALKIESFVDSLRRTLEIIWEELKQIIGKKKWLLAFSKASVKSKIAECTNRLNDAVQIFQVTSDLRTASILQSLQKEISSQVENIDKQLGKITQLLRKPLTTHIGSNGVIEPIPHKPIVFHGREDSVERVGGVLCNGDKPRVSILGSGGMGKTTLAAAVIQSKTVQDKFKLRFWVPCIQATSTALFLDLLHRYLRISRSSGNILDDVVFELNASNDPRLILLDNFETLWYSSEPTRCEIRNILPELHKIGHVALLVTMRGNRPPCHEYIVWNNHELGPVDETASRRIYHDLNRGSCHDPDVGSLLTAVGRLPFAITLMANRGVQSQSSAGFLLEEWSRLGTNMVSDEDGNLNRSISLSVDGNYVRKNPDALTLLATLSLLPAGTTVGHLQWWAPELKQVSSAIATLTGAGLLDNKTQQSLSAMPVVQSFMSFTERISDNVRKQVLEGCIEYVIHHSSRGYYDLDFKQKSAALALEAANIQSVLSDSRPTHPSDRFVRTLLAFARYRLDTNPSIEIAQQTLCVAKSSNNNRYIGEAFFAAGGTYWRLGHFKDAERYLSEAYRLLDNITITTDHDIPRFIVQCCFFLVQTRVNLDSSADLLATARCLCDRLGKVRDNFVQASIFRVLGFCHLRRPQDLNLAVDNLRRSANIFKEIKAMDCRSDVADVMSLLAKLYHNSSRLSEALEAIEAATNAIDTSGRHRMHGVISRTHGEILITLGRHEEALLKLEESLALSQQVGHLFGTAWTLEHFGFIYASRGEYEDAIMAYEAAVKTYAQTNTETSHMGRQGMKRCQDNLMKIWGNKNKEVGGMDICDFIRFISPD